MELKPGYKLTEVGVIPEEWEVRAVSEMGRVTTGKALAVNAPGKLRPYLRTKNVMDGQIVLDDVLFMPMTDEQFAQFEARAGDVLLNEGQSLELVGRCAMYRGEFGEPCAIQNQLVRFRARNDVSPDFATHLFRRCQKTGVFARIALQTTSVAHLGGARFARLALAWPATRVEQDAIAQALSDVDGLIGELDYLIAKKRDLKKAAMQQLLTGHTRLPGFHREWEVKRLAELGVFIKGSGVRKDEARSGDLRCIRYGEIYTHHNDCIRGFHSWISPSVARSATRLQRGDVLFAGSGETKAEIGKCVAFVNDDEAYAGGDIVILRPRVGEPRFLGYLLNAPAVAAQKASLGQGDAVVHISASALGTVVIPFPEVDEQRAIASVLSDMDDELSVLEARRDKTRALKEAIMQELLTGRTRLV